MRADIFVRKGVLGLALAGLTTAGVGRAQGKDAPRDVKKNTKQAKVCNKTHKPKIKSWRDEIQRGPF